MLPVDSSCIHAIATTPAGPVESCRSLRPTSGGLPHRRGGSAPVLRVSRIAQRSLTLWPACLLTPQGSRFLECFSPNCYLLEPLQVLPVGATSYRAGFAPARINLPFTAHSPKRASSERVLPRSGRAQGIRAVPRMGGYLGLIVPPVQTRPKAWIHRSLGHRPRCRYHHASIGRRPISLDTSLRSWRRR